jgi:hypothetical protein
MKSIRRLIQSRKDDERKNKTVLVPLKIYNIPTNLRVAAEHIVKFSWVHSMFYVGSLVLP